MHPTYTFSSKVVLRTPSLPFTSPVSEATIGEYLANPQFMEALYLASPDLYAKCRGGLKAGKLNAKEGRKVLYALTNYLNRMRSRCTPFGLFAGCSVVEWKNQDQIVLNEPHNSRHTRLDMHYLCSLAQHLASSTFLKEHLRYYTNSSLYQVGNEIRYVEYRYEAGQRIHQISSVASSAPLAHVLEKCGPGLLMPEINSLFNEGEADEEEIQAFIAQLIDVQLLVSELDPALTGEEFTQQILITIERIYASHPNPELEQVIHSLKRTMKSLLEMDLQGYNQPEAYEKITAELYTWGEPLDKSKLFQTDLIKSLQQGKINTTWQNDILATLQLAKRLSTKRENKRLEEFKQQFIQCYEDAEMPLLAVLDTDIGIGYTDMGKQGNAPLIEDLIFSEQTETSQSISRSAAEQFLYQKVREAERSNQPLIQLYQEEVNFLPDHGYPLPPSIAVMFRLINSDTMLLEGFSGTSAINLLGRFAHADQDIFDLIQSVTNYEKSLNPDIIFAEVVHLPEKRIGNILLRPVFREYEIPYLAKSSLPQEQQLAPQDLWVSVRNGKVVLRSKRLNKEIIPRLSTAHNFTSQSLPVYHFLCDLQAQGLQADVGVSWNPTAYGAKFLPRLVYQRVILGLATWKLESTDFESLCQCSPAALPDAFNAFQQKWHLPDYFTLADGDRDLLVDVHNPLTIEAWLETIKSRKNIVLKEFLVDTGQRMVTDAKGQPYTNQFIAPLLNTQTTYQSKVSNTLPNGLALRRKFSLGSEWLYYKLYCGTQAADKILVEVLEPLVAELKEKNLIDTWFFIRYNDPSGHLRVRFHLPEVEKIGQVIQLAYYYLKPYKESGHIAKIQTCTYQREIERYGSQTMLLSEGLFHSDSEAILAFLSSHYEGELENTRWLWGMHAIDQLLHLFGYSLTAKLHLMETLKAAFAQEFHMDKSLKTQIDQKYRDHKGAIQHVFHQYSAPPETTSAYVSAETSQRSRTIAQQILALQENGQLEVPLASLLGSYIHMHVNRLIPANQRLYELLMYDFLYRHYRSQTAILQKM